MKIDTLISRIFLQKNSRFLQFPQIDGCQIYFNQKFLDRGECIFINYILSWFHETCFEWWGISQEGISLCKLCKNLSAARKLEVFNFLQNFCMLSKSAAVVLFALPWRATSKAAEQGWKESSLNNCGMDSRPQKGTVPKYNSNGFHLRQYLFYNLSLLFLSMICKYLCAY